MTAAAIRARLSAGTPLKLGELAAAAGYSREHIRKLADAGAIAAARPAHDRAHRRVSVLEAERFLRSVGVL